MYVKMVTCRLCRAHEAAALVRQTVDEECDNICSLSTFFLGRVVTDWQAAFMFARSHPYSAHIMVRHTWAVLKYLKSLHRSDATGRDIPNGSNGGGSVGSWTTGDTICFFSRMRMCLRIAHHEGAHDGHW